MYSYDKFFYYYRAALELHDAAEKGEVERVQRLLSTGSLNINFRTVIVSISFMAMVDTIYISDFLLAVAGIELTLTKVFFSLQILITLGETESR